jgi:hypothetical protein
VARKVVALTLLLAGLGSGLPAAAAGGLKLRAQPPLYVDSKGTALNAPEGVAFGAGTAIAVSDTGSGRIATFRKGAGEITPVAEFKLAEVPYPTRLRITSKGDLLVLDGRSRRIARVAADGAFKGWIDPAASGAPVVRGFAIDRQDQLFVLDISVPRVIVTDLAGKPAREIPLPAGNSFFSDVAVGPRGDVFVLDSVGHQVYAVRPGSTEVALLGGNLAEELEFATTLAVADTGHLFVVDQYGDGVVILGPDGSFQGRQGAMGLREGFLRYPSAIAYDPAGFVYLADRANNRVQVFAIAQ